MRNGKLTTSVRYFILVLLFSICGHLTRAQNLFIKEDSLKTLLNTRYTTLSHNRITLISELFGRHLPDEPVFDSLKNLLIQEAEESRDRSLMGLAYNEIALAYLKYYGRQDLNEKGKPYADKCLQVATESGLDEYKVAAFLRYAHYYQNLSENQKALDYNNQAISLASAMGSDSLLCLSYESISETWKSLANKLSEFQALLNERNFAERSKIKSLIAKSLFDLGNFYESVNDYEKAKDFYTQCIRESRDWNLGFYVFLSLERLGRTYINEKNEKLGIAYYDKAKDFTDSAGIPIFKLQIYFDELNYYFNGVDPVKGFAFLDVHPELMVFIKKYGIEFQVNKLYAVLESSKNKNDSALYYLKLALPYEYSQKGNFTEKYQFTNQLAATYRDLHRYEDENKTLMLASRFADSGENIYYKEDVAQRLDSASYRLGDYKRSHEYLAQYNVYRDSIESLGKQKDLLSVEIQNANKRAEQQKKEDEENRRVRNNIEYMGITAVIATVFIVLVVLGVFKISPAVIRALGFFAFIFLFEFIVLLLDDQIHELTHGEPWKVLGVKIVIISLLLPLHHWLEKKMTHYLTYKAHTIKSKIFSKKA
jgi:tetratricopeptide (TPR) repeat protein